MCLLTMQLNSHMMHIHFFFFFNRFSLERLYQLACHIYTFDRAQLIQQRKQKAQAFVYQLALEALLGIRASIECQKRMLRSC